ncbi:MAG: DNA-protecting protein DprA [Treponema sp.]|nr:DNA-protecting protein DprA [Treponema sp.]
MAKKLDSSRSLALLSIEEIEKIINRKLQKRVLWDGLENLRMAERAFLYCDKFNIKILLNEDPSYPELLRQISDPPYLLFCRGDEGLLAKNNISIVGTRRLSNPGRSAAKAFAFDAVMDSCNVVSGLATGADAYAHQGAIDAFFDCDEKNADLSKLGRTIAVLPSGIDDIIPSCNKKLAGQILQTGGCIISEYEPKMEMANWHFVGRNRIIAGLSAATVVIEAPDGSGALITADFALEYNRDLLFHKVGFNEQALYISGLVRKDLEAKYAAGKVSKYKKQNTMTRYLDSGALVIEDYKDYCKALIESPGSRACIPEQGLLFND